MHTINNMQVGKDFNSWIEAENKKVQYNARVSRHIISSKLTMEEFFKASTCKNAKEMWETFKKAQESIEELAYSSYKVATKISTHAS